MNVIIPENEIILFNALKLNDEVDNCHITGDIFKCSFRIGNCCISDQISLKLITKGSISNESALVQVLVRSRAGGRLLSEPVMSQFTSVYMCHPTSVS